MTRLGLVALLLLTAVVYGSHVQHAGWVYEDSNAIFANPSVAGHRAIPIDRARWLSALSHRLVWTVAGDRPAVHHGVNVGLHLANGVLVFLIAAAFLPELGALLAAALFLLHPLQTEAVAYAASRSELLAAHFALVAVWWALRASRRWHQVAVWLAVALAICAKESAVVVIPILALVDVCRGRPIARWRYAALALPVVAMAVSVFRFDHLAQAELGRIAYAATQAAALWRYLALAIVPSGFAVDHDFDLVPWAVRWAALYGVGVLAVFPILTGLSTVHGDTRVCGRLWDDSPALRVSAFGVAWLVLAIAPRFVMRIPEILNEHQTYLPFVGVWIVLAAIGHAWLDRTAAPRAAGA